MTAAQALEAFVADLLVIIPTELPRIEQAYADFKAAHPQIGAPPPAPEQKSIDAEIDAEIAAERAKA